jgi:hypothetical protein
MSVTDYLILNKVINNNPDSRAQASRTSYGGRTACEDDSYPKASIGQEEPKASHFWQYTGLIALAVSLSLLACRYHLVHRTV